MSVSLNPAERAVADRAITRAREHELMLRIGAETVELEFDGQHCTWRLLWSADGSAGDVAPRMRRDAFLLAERLSPAAADIARASGGGFADARGNLYVRAPGVLVDVRGRPAPVQRAGDDGATTHLIRSRSSPPTWNLMSAARAQVVFCLLEWPELSRAPVRHLAHTAGVSVGSVQSTLAGLDEERHLTIGRTRLTRRGELLDQWTAAFPGGLARKLELGRFVGEPTPDAWAAAGHVVHVSGERAAEGITGSGMTIYVNELDASAVMASRWRRPRESEAEMANIVVRRRFWQSPEVWEESGEGRVLKAPETLVYADLLASGEPRQREVAQYLRERLA